MFTSLIWFSQPHCGELHRITVAVKQTGAWILSGMVVCRICQSPHPFIGLLFYFPACHTQFFCWLNSDEMCRNDECKIEEWKQRHAEGSEGCGEQPVMWKMENKIKNTAFKTSSCVGNMKKNSTFSKLMINFGHTVSSQNIRIRLIHTM